MQIDVLSFIGIFTLLVFGYGVFQKDRIANVFASILLLIIGFLILGSGIQFQTGQSTMTFSNATIVSPTETDTNTTTTTINNYANPSWPDYFDNTIFGMFILMVAIYGIYSSAFELHNG